MKGMPDKEMTQNCIKKVTSVKECSNINLTYVKHYTFSLNLGRTSRVRSNLVSVISQILVVRSGSMCWDLHIFLS